MREIRVAFLPGLQRKFLEDILDSNHLKNKDLAKLIGIHPRTFSDWKREKNHITEMAYNKLLNRFDVQPLEPKDFLINRWKKLKIAASIKGGNAVFKKYGTFATKEGRKKGGKNSWIIRRLDQNILKKYSHVINKPKESIELAELIGVLLGDGGLTNSQCVIYLNSETDKAFAIYIKKLFIRLFNISPNFYKLANVKLLRVSISSVSLVEYMKRKGLVIGNKVHLQVSVPDWIYKDPNYIKACIRGLIDTDGCFIIHRYKVNGKEYSYPKMIFSNKSLPILNFVYQQLQKLQFTPRIYGMNQVWLLDHKQVAKYLKEIGTHNYKPNVKLILKGI